MSPLRDGGLATLDDLDELLVAVALLAKVDGRLRERVAREPVSTYGDRCALARLALLQLASEIAATFGARELFVCPVPTARALAQVHRELVQALVARAVAAGRVDVPSEPEAS